MTLVCEGLLGRICVRAVVRGEGGLSPTPRVVKA